MTTTRRTFLTSLTALFCAPMAVFAKKPEVNCTLGKSDMIYREISPQNWWYQAERFMIIKDGYSCKYIGSPISPNDPLNNHPITHAENYE